MAPNVSLEDGTVSNLKMNDKRQYLPLNVGLNISDRTSLAQLAQQIGISKTELAREAIRWYIARYDEIKGQSREGEMAQAMRYATDQLVKAINAGVDRICRMLARQGRAIGTLYELSWMSLPDDENARKAFESALTKAKSRMAKHVEKDERELAERMKTVVNS